MPKHCKNRDSGGARQLGVCSYQLGVMGVMRRMGLIFSIVMRTNVIRAYDQ